MSKPEKQGFTNQKRGNVPKLEGVLGLQEVPVSLPFVWKWSWAQRSLTGYSCESTKPNRRPPPRGSCTQPFLFFSPSFSETSLDTALLGLFFFFSTTDGTCVSGGECLYCVVTCAHGGPAGSSRRLVCRFGLLLLVSTTCPPAGFWHSPGCYLHISAETWAAICPLIFLFPLALIRPTSSRDAPSLVSTAESAMPLVFKLLFGKTSGLRLICFVGCELKKKMFSEQLLNLPYLTKKNGDG